MKHTIELTDDQLTVLIALMHLGVAAVSGEPLPEASKPESWERTKRYFSARNN
jgi:hypothetical protein